MICEVATTRNTYPQLILEAIKLSDDRKYDSMIQILKDFEANEYSSEIANDSSAPTSTESLDKLVKSTGYTSRKSLAMDIMKSKTHYDNIRSYLSASS